MEIGHIFHKNFPSWNLENGLDKCFIRGAWNWSISCLNDSETQERGLKGVKIRTIPGRAYPGPPWKLRRLFRKSVSIYPRSASKQRAKIGSFLQSTSFLTGHFRLLETHNFKTMSSLTSFLWKLVLSQPHFQFCYACIKINSLFFLFSCIHFFNDVWDHICCSGVCANSVWNNARMWHCIRVREPCESIINFVLSAKVEIFNAG